MPNDSIQHIEVGLYQGYVALRLTFGGGEQVTHCFTMDLARKVAAQLVEAADMLYIEQNVPKFTSEGSGVGESVTMRLTPPSEETR